MGLHSVGQRVVVNCGGPDGLGNTHIFNGLRLNFQACHWKALPF